MTIQKAYFDVLIIVFFLEYNNEYMYMFTVVILFKLIRCIFLVINFFYIFILFHVKYNVKKLHYLNK